MSIRSSRMALVGLYASGVFLFCEVYARAGRGHQQTDLLALTDLRGETPFQYRLLVPLMARTIRAVAPLPLWDIYWGLTACFAFALLLAFRRYLEWGGLPPAIARFACLGLLYPLLWNYGLLGVFYYPGDIPAIFFFVAGVNCLMQRRWAGYYALFALATINRETSVCLVFASALLLPGKMPVRQAVGHVAAQMALWLAIKYGLAHLFWGNPGQKAFEVHVRDNVRWLTALSHGRHLLLLWLFGGIWLGIPLAWREQPSEWKRLLWLIPPFFVGMYFVGVISEVRIYNELIPIVTAPALFSFYRLFGRQEKCPT